MAYDSISVLVQSDKTILTLGSQLIQKKGTEKASEVSQKMRLLGRVVEEGRKLTGDRNATLESLLKPGNFDILVSCALSIAGYEENDGSSSKRILGLQQQQWLLVMS